MDSFIPGIFNYCDRWCERCAFTARCRVFHQEQRFIEREVLAGNDPNTLESAMRGVDSSLAEALRMLTVHAEEAGIDLDNLPPPENMDDYREHPLFQQADAWADRLEAYVNRIYAEIPQVAEEVGAQFIQEYSGCHDETVLAKAGEAAEEELARFRGALEILRQYRFLIPVKMGRATSALTDGDDDLYDANGTAKLVYECLGRVIAALWATMEFHRSWVEDAFSVSAGAEALRRALDEALPGHRTFVRPGLDENVPG